MSNTEKIVVSVVLAAILLVVSTSLVIQCIAMDDLLKNDSIDTWPERPYYIDEETWEHLKEISVLENGQYLKPFTEYAGY